MVSGSAVMKTLSLLWAILDPFKSSTSTDSNSEPREKGFLVFVYTLYHHY